MPHKDAQARAEYNARPERRAAQREYNRKRYAANPEKIKTRVRKWRAENKERKNKTERERRWLNGTRKPRVVLTEEEKKARRDAARLRWERTNPERAKEARRKANANYKARHPERVRQQRHAQQLKMTQEQKRIDTMRNLRKYHVTKPKQTEGSKRNAKQRRDTLCNHYVRSVAAGTFGIPFTQVPAVLVEVKREHIKLLRIIKRLKEQEK